jgi:hypothetical protein
MDVESRVASLEWARIAEELNTYGVTLTGSLLTERQCRELRASYPQDRLFRSRIVMARHGFGQGEYKYFARPLPETVERLRHAFYPQLAPIANDWHGRMGMEERFPATLDAFLDACHRDGQQRPTPLLLKYGAGDYNCLHQDIYGKNVFPIQLVILLSDAGTDFTGGEFVMTEQRPRMQSRAEVVPLRMGEGALFAVCDRPRQGARGDYRVRMRHGVSRIRSGERYTLGVIFHDAT